MSPPETDRRSDGRDWGGGAAVQCAATARNVSGITTRRRTARSVEVSAMRRPDARGRPLGGNGRAQCVVKPFEGVRNFAGPVRRGHERRLVG
jgi:hypothetical protein